MNLPYSGNLKNLSRRLRSNMTDAEIRLWAKIRVDQINGYRFYRQKPLGNYIVDFYCPKAKLVVEVDGSEHLEESGAKKDVMRDRYLRNLGLRVLRFTNIEVLTNIHGVVESILSSMNNASTKE
ncbi:MAG: endonuclease domain-containing protein [Dehalococcoidales bacterium]|nr:endonuclease domain-containing protein [Dehalococcoidales bacterium]